MIISNCHVAPALPANGTCSVFKLFNRVMMVCLLSVACLNFSGAAEPDYQFKNGISQEVLGNYLSRAITMNGLSYSDTPEDDYRMIKKLRAKFIGRVSYIWNAQTDFPNYYGKLVEEADLFQQAETASKRLHEIDPEIIVQACIFEIVEKDYVNQVDVPARVFAEFGLKPVARKFSYEAMLYQDGLFWNQWGRGQSVPDMSRMETQMWFFYRATRYIDIGYEAIHFGQCAMMDRSDPNHKNWWSTITRIRTYAKAHARRGLVLCDAHTRGIIDEQGNLLYDFHSFPSRPVELAGKPNEAHLVLGDRDSIYRRSKGGVSPSGWKCESLPYLVELDNTHTSGREGQGGLGGCWVWGYEEISWFAFSGSNYRNYWLQYASDWLKQNDPVGHLEMPGKIPLAFHDYSKEKRLWYRLNNPGKACPAGYGQEDKVKELWSAERFSQGLKTATRGARVGQN
jgi:hypothetical protein